MTSPRKTEPVFLDALAGPSGTQEQTTRLTVPRTFPDATAAIPVVRPGRAAPEEYPPFRLPPIQLPPDLVSPPVRRQAAPLPPVGRPGMRPVPVPPTAYGPPAGYGPPVQVPGAAAFGQPQMPLGLEWLADAYRQNVVAAQQALVQNPAAMPGQFAPSPAPGRLAPGEFRTSTRAELRSSYVPTPPVVDPSAGSRGQNSNKGSTMFALLFVIVLILAFTNLGDELMDWLKSVFDQVGK
ncbi:hypothetical protein D1871_02030 [Nakamurella silvestris]|nr:hypothetical protein D1871_02030 [Nakamurella silvestris]